MTLFETTSASVLDSTQASLDPPSCFDNLQMLYVYALSVSDERTEPEAESKAKAVVSKRAHESCSKLLIQTCVLYTHLFSSNSSCDISDYMLTKRTPRIKTSFASECTLDFDAKRRKSREQQISVIISVDLNLMVEYFRMDIILCTNSPLSRKGDPIPNEHISFKKGRATIAPAYSD